MVLASVPSCVSLDDELLPEKQINLFFPCYICQCLITAWKTSLRYLSNNDFGNFYRKFTVVLLKYNYDSSDRIRFVL